jgi:hypothetical protein
MCTSSLSCVLHARFISSVLSISCGAPHYVVFFNLLFFHQSTSFR